MKTYVITLSQHFLKGHPNAGEPTYFADKLRKGLAGELPAKIHTIRGNYDLWAGRIKEVQDGEAVLSIRQWTGKPYNSKQQTLATFMDIREEEHTLCDGRHLEVKPDVVADFTDMPFPDGSFRLVVFDPPHLKKLGKNAWMAKKYGRLLPTWETDIKAGFDECMRVLEPYGVLIFKWNECQIKMTQLLDVIKAEPLFGHPTGKNGSTVWMCFMKLPEK